MMRPLSATAPLANSDFLERPCDVRCRQGARRPLRSPNETAARRRSVSLPASRLAGISRQRYWGCPIPVIHCECMWGRAGAARADLPVTPARRCRDSMPARQPARSSSHLEAHRSVSAAAASAALRTRHRHLRHVHRFVLVLRALLLGPQAEVPRSTVTRSTTWLPVDQYIGGIEHAILHLLYAPFLHQARHEAVRSAGCRRAVCGSYSPKAWSMPRHLSAPPTAAWLTARTRSCVR